MTAFEQVETGATLVSVKPQALRGAIVEQLQQMIVEGALAPGTRLNERRLCEQLGVSRTPLREAFMVLAAKGLLELLPNRGAIVVQMSIDDIAHTFEVVAGLEALAGELACARVTAPELAEIRALHYELLACLTRRDLPGYYKLNYAIHDDINRSARNHVLRQTYSTINSRIQSLRFRSNFNQDKWDTAVREHGQMMDALATRDGAGLASILKGHVLTKCQVVIADLGSPRKATGSSAQRAYRTNRLT